MGYGVWGMGYGVWDMGYGIWGIANHMQIICQHEDIQQISTNNNKNTAPNDPPLGARALGPLGPGPGARGGVRGCVFVVVC